MSIFVDTGVFYPHHFPFTRSLNRRTKLPVSKPVWMRYELKPGENRGKSEPEETRHGY